MNRALNVFTLSESKDVLVVAPQGDAVSYRDADVASEVVEVLNRIESLPVPRIVVSFGAADYFGSVIIGAVSQFAERVRERNGVFAVCDLSPDMRHVLTAMKLTDRWPCFDTRQAAVKFAQRCES